MFKSLRATLACQLYNVGLNHSQQRQVDYAQCQGLINYKQDDQVKAVQEIIDLVAVEPPMVVVTRLIDSFNRMSSCTRRASESLSSFVTRFTGLASEQLMQVGSSPTVKIGQVLAITLLNNANLGDSTLSSAKIQLIKAAQSRQVGVMRNYTAGR